MMGSTMAGTLTPAHNVRTYSGRLCDTANCMVLYGMGICAGILYSQDVNSTAG
jgi:hypothetical protein